MQQLEQLRSSIRMLEDLQAVVRTMKAMARVAVRRYETVRESLEGYAANVDLALHAFLQDRRFQESAGLPPFLTAAATAAPAGVGVILFGSDQGLCGTFNERVMSRHRALLQELDREGGICRQAVVGRRLAALLAAADEGGERSFALPHAVEGITRLIQDLLLLIEEWRFGGAPLDQLLLVHHRVTGTARSETVVVQLLPLERAWLQHLWEKPWDSRSRPLLVGDPTELFRTIVREIITVSLHRAAVESLASENAARLAAMHSAESNLEERLGELNHAYRRERQNAITTELLDVVAGFEALQQQEEP
jgi:F-type H+-transporting ATPase subunit gamma